MKNDYFKDSERAFRTLFAKMCDVLDYVDDTGKDSSFTFKKFKVKGECIKVNNDTYTFPRITIKNYIGQTIDHFNVSYDYNVGDSFRVSELIFQSIFNLEAPITLKTLEMEIFGTTWED